MDAYSLIHSHFGDAMHLLAAMSSKIMINDDTFTARGHCGCTYGNFLKLHMGTISPFRNVANFKGACGALCLRHDPKWFLFFIY